MDLRFLDIYGPIAILMIAATVFAVVPLVLAWTWAKKFSPGKPGPQKNAPYECGLASKSDVLIRFRPEYYMYAIVFLIFDVEAIFLLPFAVAFTGLTVGRGDCDVDLSVVTGRGIGVDVAKGRPDLGMSLCFARQNTAGLRPTFKRRKAKR